MHKNRGPVYYNDYLMLDQFLNCQTPLSRKYASQENPEAHDETLFIVVHQAYELWFKQILHDLNSILTIFGKEKVPDALLGTVVQRLERIRKIQVMISGQLEVLESMTPMDFLEFRNLLIPASGFQSIQFREIEIKMGLGTHDREAVDREFFLGRLNEVDRKKLMALEGTPSLLKLLESWLERTPFTISGNFNFWNEYQKAVMAGLNEDEITIQSNMANLPDQQKKMQLENLRITRETFESLFDDEAHNKVIQSGGRKLSRKAILNALFILQYREQPMLTLPYQMINLMIDIDENFTTWRYRHALMVQRMLGTKIGTGGSSGHAYLKRAADNNRVFVDLFNLSTYLIPRSQLPDIPAEIKRQLNFNV
ncbi:MAG: tryptophan 2,3-dioxygenase family protein [Bdellovibrionota bacterium]